MASLYPHHIPLSTLQRVLLGIGSTAMALKDPYRDDMVAVSGETTAGSALQYMKEQMEDDETGRRILKEKPRVSSSTIDLKRLSEMPKNTFGRQYMDMLTKYKIHPDTRKPVKFVDDPEHAYILQRYREVHDFNHLLIDQPTNYRGEVAVKWYEAIQTTLPMCWMAAFGGTAKMDPKQREDMFANDFVWILWYAKRSKFFMNLYFEEHFEEDITELRKSIGIILSPYKK